MERIQRRYVALGNELIKQLKTKNYKIGDRLPTERDIAESFAVSRTAIRDAIIMLELQGLVEVRKGSGVYVTALPDDISQGSSTENSDHEEEDLGIFEMLQARQLLESNIAEFAAIHVTRAQIVRMKHVLDNERKAIEAGNTEYDYDNEFHVLIAKSTQNNYLVEVANNFWKRRAASKMWAQLHTHIHTDSYRKQFLDDHAKILSALQKKDPALAKQAMWQHMENVKDVLFSLSDVDSKDFDGYLFDSYKVD
ncbi:FCD domain-containing protein [Psychromonas ossibalaenae]|uniref:FCD domain-containing protein n=1 Tax=Psychromonas ossibalaenae TaxID=444922 RepID=UPI000360A6B7|nr:FCD domain-containing protein [Psychromonas ossibalaenae]